MEALIFSTHRRVREYISTLPDGLLPKLYTIDEFISKSIVVDGKVFVDSNIRAIYLYKAVKNIDIEKLGFSKNFLSFISDSDFIFRVFEELFAEKKSLDELVSDVISKLSLSDIYSDYEEHLQILNRLFLNYKQILEDEGLVDRVTIDNFKLNRGFLDTLDKITIYLDGFPSRFELSIYQMIGSKIELVINSSPFNTKVLERLDIKDITKDKTIYYLPSKKKIVSIKELPSLDKDRVEVASFSQRIDQCGWILAKIYEFVSNGYDPSKIAIILPDEEFSEYLRLFDKKRNFNYAMGIPFTQSRYYQQLIELYDAITNKREYLLDRVSKSQIYQDFNNITNFKEFIEFLSSLKTSSKEQEIIQKELFIFSRFESMLSSSDKLDLLHSWLSRLEELSIDDVGGGKITVMGLLESRGLEFDAVIIPDFNEGIVPHVTQKDLFLNSTIKRACGMPTRSDKENLQKHYYYSLIRNSKSVAISYISNEEHSVSRFLIELGFSECKESKSSIYRDIIAPQRDLPSKEIEISDKNIFINEPKFTPTRLKDALECKRRLYYKYMLSISKESKDEINLGSIIHKALELTAKSKDQFNDADGYFGMLNSKINALLPSSLDRFRFAIEWEDRLKRFCNRDFDRLKRATQIKIEEFCSFKFLDFELFFKVDRVDLLDNKIILIDYKTGSNISTKVKKDENDFQLLFYYLWAKEHYPNYQIEPIYEALKDEKVVTIDIDAKLEALRYTLNTLPKDEIISYPKTDELEYCKYCPYVIACERDI